MTRFDYVWPKGSWQGAETTAVAIKTRIPGLIIIKKPGCYTVTHESSGYRCIPDCARLKDALLKAEWMGQIIDATDPNLNQTINAQSKEFVQYLRKVVNSDCPGTF